MENRDEGFGPDDDDELQAVLIDFGQAVDWRHPSAMDLLNRDLSKVRDFFMKKGVKTLTLHLALEFVTAPEPDQEDETTIDSKRLADAAKASAQHDATFSEIDQTTEFVPPTTGDGWGQGTDAFQSAWPNDWPDSFESGNKHKGK